MHACDSVVKILVVEDDKDNLDILQELLDGEGYDIFAADNGADAVKLAQDEQPAVILMDLQMPDFPNSGLNNEAGLVATRDLRSDPRTQSIPIVALTGFDTEKAGAAIMAAGCDAIANKPYDFSSLLETIADLIRHR